jgi:catechol 2,3-dioxygenase-like lactoylglutathione lyase family enzyme
VLQSTIDHVAVAVPDPAVAAERWHARLGGEWRFGSDEGGFRFRQLRYAGGGKLELLSPPQEGSGDFVRRFLARFGSTVHHVTLKVPDLAAALPVLEEAELPPVDVDQSDDEWHEAFLRPSLVGGLVVQIAWARWSDDELVARERGPAPLPAAAQATLLGPRLRHPDLLEAERIWRVLGAEVQREDGLLRCTWPSAPLEVVIERGEPAGPVALRMRGTPALPREEGVGPAVEA